MKTIKIALVLVMFGLLCGAAAPKKATYEKQIDKFFAGILRGEVSDSYDELFKGTLLEEKKQAVQMLKAQTHTVFNLYGKQTDFELIKKQKYGDSVLRVVYILKCEKLPVAFEFYFYKLSSDWNLTNITFNDDLALLGDK